MAGHTSPREQFCGSTEPSWYAVTLTAGANIAVHGKAGYQVKVYGIILSAATSTTATFQDGSTPFTGAMPYTGLALDLERKPFITSTGNDFVITSGGNAAGAVFASIN